MVNNMYPARVEALLFELIAEVGLDIDESPYPQELVLNPPLSVDGFTDAVLALGHSGPVRPALRSHVRARVLKHFLDAKQEGAG